jgi:iron complex transport system permease protein
MRKDLSASLCLGAAIVFTLTIGLGTGELALDARALFSAVRAEQLVIYEIRLPRLLAGLIAGFALGASGAALQGLLRNPLAEPGVLGVSASAALAATLAIHYGFSFGLFGVQLAALTGALVATALLALAAARTASVVTLILIGVGLSSFAGALMNLLMNLAPNPFTLSDLVNWMLGSVAHRSLADIAGALPLVGLGLLLVMASGRALDRLSLGEEVAISLGTRLVPVRMLIVVGTGVMTGASVALAGVIGFIGIVAPHVLRPIIGYHPSRLILPSGLLGGLVLMLADLAIRLIPTTQELKIGVMAALIGAPAFVWIALQRRSMVP